MECKPAASSTTPVSSCERIIAEFQANGVPHSGNSFVPEGGIMGGFEIKTPKVGDGFIEWGLNGYDSGHDLEGKHKNPPAGVNYDKHGDWMYDKSQVVHTAPADEAAITCDNYTKKGR